jgi:tRNA threonylcarbamoyladenosine biosynthesis protein TsaB
MLILTIRTDRPQAEIGLFDDTKQLDYQTWSAHRQLAESLHTKIKDMLEANSYDFVDLGGIGCYAGPGSFTGLRIGLTVANTLSYGLGILVTAKSGDAWHEEAIGTLRSGESEPLALPFYGAEANITKAKK